MTHRFFITLGVLASLNFTTLAADSAHDDALTYAGLSGAKVFDSGVIAVTGGGAFDRTETFEYLRRPDGGITLINLISATDGAYRVAARFDLDDQWQSQRATGLGLYDGKQVRITMQRTGAQVDIAVAGTPAIDTKAVCEPSCFINMSPSITSMFVMTRHYDMKTKGVQVFQWAGQDLDRVRTLSGGKARLQFAGDEVFDRQGSAPLTLRHFTFVEELPGPNGAIYKLDFDLWADADHRPFGFRVRPSTSKTSTLIGFRLGFDDVKAAILARDKTAAPSP
jgi:hypothetical protein